MNNKITEISPKMVFTVKDKIQDLLDLTDFYHRRMDFVLFSVSLCVSYRNLDKGDHANHGLESVIPVNTGEILVTARCRFVKCDLHNLSQK